MSILDYITTRNYSPQTVMFMYWSRSPISEIESEIYTLDAGWFDLLLGKDFWMWESVGDLHFCREPGCEEPTMFYPTHWDERLQIEHGIPGICEKHCEDHEFEHDSDISQYACIHCGMIAPDDFYYD